MHVEWKTVTDNPQLTIKLTLSPRKVEIPACRSLIYSCKAKISAWKFKKLLQITLCLGALGLGTACCGSSEMRVLKHLQKSAARATPARSLRFGPRWLPVTLLVYFT